MAVTEQEALRAYAKMLNTLSVGSFADFLADDFIYESQQVLSALNSKEAFLDYMEQKLATIAQAKATVYAEMGTVSAFGRDRPCVVLAQDDITNLIALAISEFSDGKLTRIDLCVVPSPETAKRSGEYPQ
ncbi:hypothetical protein [Petrachloros mirabilis]